MIPTSLAVRWILVGVAMSLCNVLREAARHSRKLDAVAWVRF